MEIRSVRVDKLTENLKNRPIYPLGLSARFVRLSGGGPLLTSIAPSIIGRRLYNSVSILKYGNWNMLSVQSAVG